MLYRLTTHFIAEVVQSELRKQWTWEPRMGESLILSLLDPDDVNLPHYLLSSYNEVVNSIGPSLFVFVLLM